MKIITKAMDWTETNNPFVGQLVCPSCDKPGAVLEPKFVLTDGPNSHVNLSKIEGKVFTTQGKCPHCRSAFLWRVMISPAGTFSWTDLLINAKAYNELLASHSVDQLPCLCESCQKKKGLKPDHDESTGAVSAVSKIHPKPHDPPLTAAKVVTNGQTGVENLADIASVVATKGRMLTDKQVREAAQSMGYVEKMNAMALSKEQLAGMWDTITEFLEAYVRIRFATFQPKENDDPTMPPHFPAIVPTAVYKSFKVQEEYAHLCQYIVSTCASVDVAFKRADLPASVICTYMCGMCKVTECPFHPSKRKEES